MILARRLEDPTLTLAFRVTIYMSYNSLQSKKIQREKNLNILASKAGIPSRYYALSLHIQNTFTRLVQAACM